MLSRSIPGPESFCLLHMLLQDFKLVHFLAQREMGIGKWDGENGMAEMRQ